MKHKCNIEEFQPDGAHADHARALDSLEVGALFYSLADKWSSIVNISINGQSLSISFSRGNCAVMAALGEDDFYDLVGDLGAAGWIEFVHGGQPAEHPRRHCVPIAMATKVTERFIDGFAIDPCDGNWEQQKSSQSA
jgi:hypothetical protein